MATIKSFTDLQQSKVLAEILPVESADMKILPFTEKEYRVVPINDIAICDREDEIPCWSLAALLYNIPSPVLSENSGSWTVSSLDSKFPISSFGNGENPIDACYEMVLKLHKLNLL